MCFWPNLLFVYVGGKFPCRDVVEAKVPIRWLVFCLRELLADRSTICPKSKLDPLKSSFRFPGVYQVKQYFMFCAQAWNNIDKLLRYVGGKIVYVGGKLAWWSVLIFNIYLLKAKRSVENRRFSLGFSGGHRPSK